MLERSWPLISRVISNFHFRKRRKLAKSKRSVSAAELMRHTLIPTINLGRDRILLIPTISLGRDCVGPRYLRSSSTIFKALALLASVHIVEELLRNLFILNESVIFFKYSCPKTLLLLDIFFFMDFLASLVNGFCLFL